MGGCAAGDTSLRVAVCVILEYAGGQVVRLSVG